MRTDRFTVAAVTLIVLGFFAGLVVLEETGKGADARALVGYLLTAGTGLGTIGTVVAKFGRVTKQVDNFHADIQNGILERPVRKAVQDAISPRAPELRTRASDVPSAGDPRTPAEGSPNGGAD